MADIFDFVQQTRRPMNVEMNIRSDRCRNEAVLLPDGRFCRSPAAVAVSQLRTAQLGTAAFGAWQARPDGLIDQRRQLEGNQFHFVRRWRFS
ncbi:hypothetical protein [Bradyrhizobium sp. 2TAF24]|uniref:hypothetical protein n=1 Tax=Bradyrhizobium sp. 2TAF24 TaxID=3233011 RepID=UPI003F91ED64